MKKKGFSLLEVIIVAGLITVLTGAIVFVYLSCFRAWNAGLDHSTLRIQLAQTLENMTRDISKATALELENANSLVVTVSSSKQYRFYLYSADDPGPAPLYTGSSYCLMKSMENETYGQGETLVEGVRPTVFSLTGDMVTVDLTATANGSTVHMRTMVKPRN